MDADAKKPISKTIKTHKKKKKTGQGGQTVFLLPNKTARLQIKIK